MFMEIEKLKKVELHVHLDGSLSPKLVSKLMNISEKEAREKLIANKKVQDLNDYLDKFSLPVELMQSAHVLTSVAKDLVNSLIVDNVIYAEVRFAPNKHTTKLSLENVIDAVLLGLKSKRVKVNLILCMMRGDSFEQNKKIIDLAHKYINYGVVGIDLAGAEGLYKTSDYAELFRYASSLNIPFTIHAGEAAGGASIMSAIDAGAKRIGHGVRAIESKDCLNILKDKDILLEVCPTSNIQTHVCNSIKNHPIKKLLDEGIAISVNTDNRTVSDTNLNHEYEILAKAFNLTEKDFNRMNVEAIKHAFISDFEKIKLIDRIWEVE